MMTRTIMLVVWIFALMAALTIGRPQMANTVQYSISPYDVTSGKAQHATVFGKKANKTSQTRLLPARSQLADILLADVYTNRQTRSSSVGSTRLLVCPLSSEGSPAVRCPSRYTDICIEDFQLCDGSYDCPGREDEDPTTCLFHTMVRDKLNLIEWAVARLNRISRRH